MNQKIGLIGSGKVASYLGNAFFSIGINVQEVYSRNYSHAQQLAEKINAKALPNISDFSKDLDVIIVSISDSALTQINLACIPKNIIICHSSGSVGMDVLDQHPHFGVFYPLQTFSEENLEGISIPFCLEANSATTLNKLTSLAKVLSEKIYFINSQEREQLHVAAVFANNFTNLMYSIAENILNNANLNFDLLRPLINETARKANLFSPEKVQTGPAIRQDFGIMKKHLKLLEEHPKYSDIYKVMSELLINKKNDEKL